MKNRKKNVVETILQAVVATQEQIAEIKKNMATKDNLSELREELLEQIRPIARAADKDAVTIINHEWRITRLESRQIARR